MKRLYKNSFDIIVATAKDGCIGINEKLPWRIPEDTKYFAKLTTNVVNPKKQNAVVMGRKTWDSIPRKFRPLKDRKNIVISRSLTKACFPDVDIYNNFNTAIDDCCWDEDIETTFVIGGGEIYKQSLLDSRLENVYLTEIDIKIPDGDAFFPKLPTDDFRLVKRSKNKFNNEGYLTYNFSQYHKRNKDEERYQNLLQKVIDKGISREDRTGVGTISTFGERLEFDLRYSFPLLTTKKVFWKGIVEELLWFIRGSTDARKLQDKGIHIWDGNTSREFLDQRGLTHYREGDIGPCFTGDVHVLTNKGYIPIKDIMIGDIVYTHLGNWKKVTELHKKSTTKIMKIKMAYHREINVTPEHPFYARKFVVKDRYKGQRNVVILDKPGWIPASELTKRHLVGFKVTTEEKIPQLKLIRYIPHEHKHEKYIKKLNKPEEWFMFGYFLGDGWIVDNDQRCIYFAINIYQKNNILKKLRKVLKLQVIKEKNPKTLKCHTYKCSNAEYAQILQTFGKYAHGKKIPGWVHEAPKKYIKYFLDGYCSADGCIRVKTTNDVRGFTTVSADIAFSVQRLYLKLGYMASVQFQKRDYKKLWGDRMVNYRDCYNIDVVEGNKRRCNYSYIDNNGYAWFSLKKKGFCNNQSNVYNLEVQDDQSYTVENLAVHNCYGFQWRHFGADYKGCDADYTGQGVDQLQNIIDEIKKNPTSRRLYMSAWNPKDELKMSLPPCHLAAQFYMDNSGGLSCQMYQRSNDLFLGNPFNIASYALLTKMVAQVTDLRANRLIMCLGDTHVYKNHIKPCQKQISRIPYRFPSVELNPKIKNINEFTFKDIILKDYYCYPAIKAKMAV